MASTAALCSPHSPRAGLRELRRLRGVDVVVDTESAGPSPTEDAGCGPAAANMGMLRIHAATTSRPASVVFRFALSGRAGSRWNRSCSRERAGDRRQQRVVARDTQRARTSARLVVRVRPLSQGADPELPFDEGAASFHSSGGGQVADAPRTLRRGWIKRGPSGVIGTNKKDSQDTVDTLVADLAEAGEVLSGLRRRTVRWLLSASPRWSPTTTGS